MKDIHWKLLKRKTAFANPWLELHLDTMQLPDGTIIDDYVVITKMDVVMLVATDEHNNLLTINEYKYPLDQTIKTLPAGTIELHTNADPLQEGLRELREETGYTTDDAEVVASLNMYCTKDTHRIHIIRARNARKTAATDHGVTEFIEVKVMPLAELSASVQRGDWTSADTLAALARCRLI